MIREKIAKIGRFVVCAMSFVFMLFLFVFGLRSSFNHWYEEIEEYTELLVPRVKDDFVQNIVVLMFVLAVVVIIWFWRDKLAFLSGKGLWVGIAMAITLLVLAIIWVYKLEMILAWDPEVLVSLVGEAKKGNWSCFKEGQYMSNYFHQLGLFSVLYVLTQWITDGWWYYQIINCLALAGILVVGYKITQCAWKSEFIGGLYLPLQFLCLPAFFYKTFIYGELVSVFLCMCAIWLVYLWADGKGSVLKFVFLVCAMFGALWIRKNALIVLIAILCCVALELLCNKKRSLIAIAAAMIVSFLMYQVAGNVVFADKTKECKPIPAVTWVVMGMEKNALGYGGFNAFATLTFVENGCDVEMTKEQSYARIREIVKHYIDNPEEGLNFYKEKILWQWTDPSFESIFATHQFESEGIARRIYYEDLRVPIWKFMESYQNLIYFGVLCGVISCFKNRKTGIDLIIPTLFVGYFLFSLLWEAKPRYMVMCYILMIPFAAYGITQVCRAIKQLVYKIKK